MLKRKLDEISTDDDVATPKIDPCISQTIPVEFNSDTLFNIDDLLANIAEIKQVLNDNPDYTADFIIGDGAHTLDFDLTKEEVKEINSNFQHSDDLPVVKQEMCENILNFYNQYNDRIRGLDGTFINISSDKIAKTLFKPDLEKLSLFSPEFKNNTSLTFIELISKMTKLQSVGIISPIFKDEKPNENKDKNPLENYEKLISTIQNHPSITDLQVCINTKYNVESLFNKPVKHLTIYYKMEPDNSEMKLNNIEALFNNSNLLRLDLHLEQKVWSESVIDITNVIQNHPTLEVVTVSNSTAAILNQILQNKKLKGLAYTGNKGLSLDSLPEVTKAISKHPSLESLTIKDVNAASGGTFDNFLNTLFALPTLNILHLDLPKTSINPNTIDLTTTHLTALNMDGCRLGNNEASSTFFEKMRKNNLIYYNYHHQPQNDGIFFFCPRIKTNEKNYERRLNFQRICVLISFMRANPNSEIRNSIISLIDHLIMPFCDYIDREVVFAP